MLAPAETVRDFLNTYDVEADADELASPAELAVWLREHGLTGPGDRACDDDLATAVALREGLRAALRGAPADLPVLPLRVTTGDAANVDDERRADQAAHAGDGPRTSHAPHEGDGPRTSHAPHEGDGRRAGDVGRAEGRPRLAPIDGGVRGALAAIAAATAGASWDRLKVCAEVTCQWAFLDASRNRSRSWCSMRVCGNRTKTRAYRARKQGSRPPQGPNTDTV
ncbi:CGNR zinc finger domain-containing protein [Nonomuraea indica]|uniref:CGNR zinc finger domain-containing protein n=1 Tax=Nonomuraea indica TaxID=1581193 RepID=A0ABW8AB72_9ACTN